MIITERRGKVNLSAAGNKKSPRGAKGRKKDITLDCFLYNNQGLYLFDLDI